MAESIRKWLGKGITPGEFIDWMSKNQEQFKDYYNGFSWNGDDQSFFEGFQNKDVRCAIIASDWCGDVVHNMPVVIRLLESAHIPTEVFILEENEELINKFLLYGGKSIPVVLLTNQDGEVIHRWGPRPDYIQEPMAQFKTLDLPRDTDEYKEKVKKVYAEIHIRYGDGLDYQQLIVDEFRKTLSAF